MLDFTKPIQTRDGRPVRIISADGLIAHPITGIVNNTILSWDKNGSYFNGIMSSAADLINTPQPRKVYTFTETGEERIVKQSEHYISTDGNNVFYGATTTPRKIVTCKITEIL